MKFILGFFIGLLTGVTIILGPVIAIFVSLGISGISSDEPTDDTAKVRYSGMSKSIINQENLP